MAAAPTLRDMSIKDLKAEEDRLRSEVSAIQVRVVRFPMQEGESLMPVTMKVRELEMQLEASKSELEKPDADGS